MDREHEQSVSTQDEKNDQASKKVLTVEDLAAVVGGRTLSASEAKGPLGIGEVRYAVPPTPVTFL